MFSYFRVMISHEDHEFDETNTSEENLGSCFLTGLHMGKSIILIKNVLRLSRQKRKENLMVLGAQLSWERCRAVSHQSGLNVATKN